MKADLLTLVPPALLFNMFKSKFTKVAKFPATSVIIDADYLAGTFASEIQYKELKKTCKDSGKIEDFTEFSEILISRVSKEIKAKKIDKFILSIDLIGKKTNCNVYYIAQNDEAQTQELNSIF